MRIYKQDTILYKKSNKSKTYKKNPILIVLNQISRYYTAE